LIGKSVEIFTKEIALANLRMQYLAKTDIERYRAIIEKLDLRR